ncbi:MAG: hypothetical protein AAGB35_08180 [Pseudomonadota bacterium]
MNPDKKQTYINYAKAIAVTAGLIAGYFGFFVDKAFTLNASTSDQKIRVLGEETDKFSTNAKIQIVFGEINVNAPTSAYLGIFDARDTSNTIVFYLTKNRQEQVYNAGYKIFENTEKVFQKELAAIPLDSSPELFFKYDQGVVTINIDKRGDIKVHSDFGKIIPYVSAVSGQVRFRFSELDINYKSALKDFISQFQKQPEDAN